NIHRPMNQNLSAFAKRRTAVFGILLLCGSAIAFPPAPHHILYGMVRNQFGEPLNDSTAVVYLETPTGVQLRAGMVPNLEPGVNYRLEVPIDSGASAKTNPYITTALLPYS